MSWGVFFYYSKTKAVPKVGGEYIEGIVGQPLHINPLLSESNETDASLSRLIYSGIFKYDNQGKLTNDLAENYEVSEDKTAYKIFLKKNVLWHDKTPMDAQDVIFTINLLSNPTYKSPLRLNWQGIETALVDDYTIEFKIKTPYVGFLNNLTFGILPKHVWESITPENFSLNPLNLAPIGSGPYKFDSSQKDSNGNILSYKLVSFSDYFKGKTYISKMTFNFYTDEDSAIDALNRKEIMGIDTISSEKIKDIKVQKSINVNQFSVPRYSAIFFNQNKSVPLAEDEVRTALNLATDRQEIINNVIGGNAQPVFSPFLPGMIGYSENLGNSEFNIEKANQILDEAKWTKGEDGFRAKDDINLEINLYTTDWEELSHTAEIIKAQWEKVGTKVNIHLLSIADLRENNIRPREYDALLFGQDLGADPDPYYFWHSDNKRDSNSGSNLSLFGTDESDKLIEAGRSEFDSEKRAQNYIDFQNILTKEAPAVFLYSPSYIYPVSNKIKGIEIRNLLSHYQRFSNIENWYIKTQRVKK